MSLDIGSTPRLDDVPGATEHTIAVKPIARFAARWEALLERARAGSGAPRDRRWRRRRRRAGPGGAAPAGRAARTAPEIALVTREGLLPSHNRRVRPSFARFLAERGIRADRQPDRAGRARRLLAADGGAIAFDEALWVTEAAGAPWLAATGLPLDAAGLS